MKRYISKLFAICLAVFIAAGIQAVPANAATAPEVPTPTVSKTITDNENGTYDITMSVTPYTSSLSQTTPVDVIIIFDSSGSMDEDETGYESYATGRYGLRNSSYVRLYQRTSGWGGYSQINNDSYSGTVYVSTGYNNYTEYTGERYRQTTRTRLQIAKSAVNMLTSQLLANNTAENPELVQVKVINFASIVRGSSGWMKTATEAENYVNGITLATGDYAGTNWEDALDESIQTAVRSDENTYVIFISDGNPTFRNTPQGGNNTYRITNSITVYGNGNTNSSADVNRNLAAAQAKASTIINSGRHLYSIGVFGDADRMDNLSPNDQYYNATDTDELTTAFTNILNSINYQVKNEDVTLTDGITQLTSSFVKTDPSSFRYTKDGAAWAEAPAATYENGVVSWNLGNVDTNAVPYTLTFTVWPSQEAYDILADLENGKKDYDNLTDDEKKQIVPISGGYGLNTNTEAGLTYTRVDTITTNTEPDGFVEGQPATDGYTYTYDADTGVYTGILRTDINQPITNPDPVPLTSGKISVVKEWIDSLDNNNRGTSVDFNVLCDGNEYGTITLTAADEWKGEISVAPGLVVGNEPLEEGHEYKIVETTELAGYDGAAAEDFHPMLYNGVLKTTENGNAEIKLTNELMSRLIVSKTVEKADGADEPDPNQLFTFKGTLTGNENDKYAFSIPEIDDMTNRVDITPDENDIFWAESGKEFTVQLKDGESFVFNSLPKGVAYEIEENGVDNYITAVTSDTATISDNKASGSIAASNTAYEVNYTNTYTRKTVTAEIPVTKVLDLGGLTGPDSIAEEFTFTLAADDDAPLPEVTELKNPDADGGTVTFGDIEYHEAGTYVYTVTESGSVAGVTNDGAKTITVEVTEDEDGNLIASVKGANPTDNDPSYTEFTNKYSVTPTTAQIKAKKILHNADLTNGQFNFELTALDGAPMPTSLNASNDADGNIVFGDITYNEPGSYTYTIKETRGELGYYDYDELEKTVTVEVVDNGNGTLSANVVATAIPTFENRYNANSNEVVISAAKNVNGDAAGSNIFNFKLTAVTEGAPMPDDAAATNSGGSVIFGPITYNANIFAGMTGSNRVKTFKYTIEEVAGNAEYYDYDAHKENVTVTVVDKGAGEIEATVSYDEDGAIFNNTYEAEGEVEITATKKLDGRELAANDFIFRLYEGEEVIGETRNNANGDISFKVDYRVEGESRDLGTHVYTIKEIHNDSLNGVIGYDESEKTVTVEVLDNKDGSLSATVDYGTEKPVFKNTYNPNPGKIELTANKELQGGTMTDDQFKFEVKDPTTGEVVATGTNDADGKIEFTAIPVSEVGTYTYVAYEVAGDDEGITYDGKEITYTVVVTDVDGQLEAAISSDTDTAPTFVNMVNSRLDISKTVETIGKIAADEDQLFTFNIKLSGNDGAKYPFSIMNGDTAVTDASRVSNEDGSYVATSGSEITVHIKDGENIVFENLPIGTEYAVNEVSPAAMGYSFDSITNSDGDATIDEQGTSGTITKPATDYDIDVVNNFNLNPAEARISVEKILDIPEGLEGPANIRGEFEFELTAADGTPLPEDTKLTNPDVNGGEVVFGPISYNTVGTYTYQITESGTVDGITNDSNNSKTVTVKVAYDPENEDLAAEVAYPDNGDQTTVPSSVVFTNTYSVNPTTATITAKKVLNRAKLAEGAFEFELSVAEGSPENTPMPTHTTTVNKADGSIEFGEITYNMPGTYKYKITEKAGEAGYYDYDSEPKEVTVTVIDNGNGALTARVADDGANATFTNTYKAESNEAPISAAKYVNGDPATKDIFEFKLFAEDGTEIETVNNQGGSVTFTPIKYDASIFDEAEPEETVADAEATAEAEATEEADGDEAVAEAEASEPEEAEGDAPRKKVFHYTIKETKGNAPGYGYDDGSVDVTVTVTDEGEGKLNAVVEYGDKTAFYNTYEASGSITVSGFKNLVGKDLTEGMFKFGVYEGDVLVAEAPNDADGNIEFNIGYKVDAEGSDVGTHNYTVREIVESPATGMTYDNSSKDLTVVVSDNGDGTLGAEAQIIDRLDFENEYKPLPGTYSLEAEKVLEGRSMAAGEFKFELKNENGEVVASGTNDADGVIKFSPIGFTEVGEYNLTAYEVAGDADNIVYDETEILYHVKVEDVNGQLVASAEAAPEAIFVNEYIPEDDKPDTGDSTNMALWIAMMLVAGGGLAGSRVLARKKR